jgi:hypothetical protein
VGDFLWGEDGIWISSSEEQKERLRDEQAGIVMGTLLEYPREQLLISADHFWQQLHTFGLSDYDPDPYILEMADNDDVPVSRSRYLQTRQAHETLHEEFFAAAQDWTVITSLLVLATWFAFARHWSSRLVGLTAIILTVVIANAAVTGTMSTVEDRYQARVIWLVPLLAGVCVLEWLDYTPSGQRWSRSFFAPIERIAFRFVRLDQLRLSLNPPFRKLSRRLSPP